MRTRVAIIGFLASVSILEGVVAAVPSGPPADRQGRPLRSESGAAILYPQEGSGADFRRPRPQGPGRSVPQARKPDPGPSPSAFDPALLRDDYTVGSFNQQLGTSGIHAVDVDGDGRNEIVVGHSMMWYLLRYEPAAREYRQLYFHETGEGGTFGGGGIDELEVGDLDGDGTLEVVLIMDTAELVIHDARSGNFRSSQPSGRSSSFPYRLELADLASGGGLEIIVLDDRGFGVFAAGNPTPLWTVGLAGGKDVAAGELDGDDALEIVIPMGTGNPGIVVDARLRSEEWSYSFGFGELVDVADVDGDGLDEIVATEVWRSYLVIDGDTRAQKWAANNFNTSAIRAVDIDGDSVPEVVVGDRQWGDVRFVDGLSGVERFVIANPEHSVANVDVADVDGDCEPEVVWGAGFSSTGSDRLYVADLATRTREWENLENDGPMHCFAVGDRDGDGRTEVLRAGSESDAGYDGALVFVTDLHHFKDSYQPTTPTNDGWMVTQSMALAQLDADLALEYVINDSRTYSGKVSAFDAVTHLRQWTTAPVWDGEYISSITSADLDQDGDIEVLVGTGREHTGAAGAFLRILDGSNGALLWQSPALPADWDGVGDMRIADVDGDGANEIVWAKLGNGLRVTGAVSHGEEWFLPLASITAIEVGDADGDSDPDILVGDDGGGLVAYDGQSHVELFRNTFGTEAILAIRMADLDRDGVPEIVLTRSTDSGSSVSLLEVRRRSDRALLWQSGPLAGAAGSASSLYIADVDDDERLEIAVSTSYTLRFFEYQDGAVDSTPPVFDGPAGLQSATLLGTDSCCPVVDLVWTEATDDLRPPVEFNVYRDTLAGFEPEPHNLVARTPFTSYRDASAWSGVNYHYLVRAVDREGHEDNNRTERAVLTPAGDTVPPDQGNVLRAVRSGDDVVFHYSAGTGTLWRLHDGPSKYAIGAQALVPDTSLRTFTHHGAMRPGDRYYSVRGLSPCRRTPGP